MIQFSNMERGPYGYKGGRPLSPAPVSQGGDPMGPVQFNPSGITPRPNPYGITPWLGLFPSPTDRRRVSYDGTEIAAESDFGPPRPTPSIFNPTIADDSNFGPKSNSGFNPVVQGDSFPVYGPGFGGGPRQFGFPNMGMLSGLFGNPFFGGGFGGFNPFMGGGFGGFNPFFNRQQPAFSAVMPQQGMLTGPQAWMA